MTQPKIGVLLLNLGTPSAPTKEAISVYLSEFLMDRCVVDLPRWFWKPLLHRVIIPKRVEIIAEHYQSIWLNDRSPLLYYSEQLLERLQTTRPEWTFSIGMTYGEPSIDKALEAVIGCDEIYLLPLYPQYSTTTTIAGLSKLDQCIEKHAEHFKAQFLYVNDYADDPDYIEALYQSAILYLNECPELDTLLLSYHGIPLKYIKRRKDPYVARCQETTRLLSEKLAESHPNLTVKMSYQSKFGKGQWTSPSTSGVLAKLGKEGHRVAVMCPGFSMDCIETLYEIEVENREIFTEAGGTLFHYIPALNSGEHQVNLVLKLIDKILIENNKS